MSRRVPHWSAPNSIRLDLMRRMANDRSPIESLAGLEDRAIVFLWCAGYTISGLATETGIPGRRILRALGRMEKAYLPAGLPAPRRAPRYDTVRHWQLVDAFWQAMAVENFRWDPTGHVPALALTARPA